MRIKILFLSLLIIVIALHSTAGYAGGAIKFSGVSFSLGSLIASGTLTGLGNTDVSVTLDASGIPVVTCTNQGGNQAPGQNPPKVSASGVVNLYGIDLTRKNGKSPFEAEADQPSQFLTGLEGGCPNNNWTADIDFVFWTEATITVKSLATGEVLAQQDYTCTTTETTVSCTPVN